MTAEQDLVALLERIEALREIDRATLERGEPLPIRSVTASFTDDDWNALTRIVRVIGDEHRTTLNRFLGETGLSAAIVGVLADDNMLNLPGSRREDPPKSIATLVHRINEREDEDTWLLAIPLYNISLPETLIELDERCFVVGVDQELEYDPWGANDEPGKELQRRLGDRLKLRARWIHAGSVHPKPLDTRTGAMLVSVISGTQSIATNVAQAHAAYLLAGWTLFDPPEHRRSWPTCGAWAPQPFVRLGTAIKPMATGAAEDQERRQRTPTINTYGEYELTDSIDRLRRPLQAIRAASDQHCARALLSATWAWHNAVRDPSALQTTDRMLYAFTAIASLCEDPDTRQDADMFRRWRQLQRNVPDLHARAVEVGLTAGALSHTEKSLKNARNLAAHGSDAALVNLGYPAGRTRDFRGGEVPGTELALASLHASLRPSLWLARESLLHCWTVAADQGFDDAAFEGLMQAAPST